MKTIKWYLPTRSLRKAAARGPCRRRFGGFAVGSINVDEFAYQLIRILKLIYIKFALFRFFYNSSPESGSISTRGICAACQMRRLLEWNG